MLRMLQKHITNQNGLKFIKCFTRNIERINMNEKIYADTDSEKLDMKLRLNSIYGSRITHAFPLNKRKDFIVVHESGTGKKIVVFVDAIVTIKEHEIGFNFDTYCNIKETLADVVHLLHNKGYM